MTKNTTIITSGGLLTRNTIYSLFGQGLPVLVALFAIPLLIKNLGVERFGILTMAWMITGYFGLFDLGIGRALTKLVAEKIPRNNPQEITPLVWTALFITLIAGILGTILMVAISPYLVQDALKIPPDLQTETIHSFYLLAFSIPIVISSACLLGVLAAYQRFDLVNLVRIPVGALTFLSPLLVLPFSKSIFDMVAVLVVVRFIEWLANLLLCFKVIPLLRQAFAIQQSLLKHLMSFGGWMTVSNIVGPLMVYLDRFLIGSMLSVSAVAYYTTPYEMVSRLMIFPGALVGVLFPAFSTSFEHDRVNTTLVFSRGLKYIFLTLFPVILIVVTFAYEGLEIWLGSEFAQNSTRVLQWLAAGALINSQAYMPFALLHAAGRPDLTAKLHIIEAPFYILAILWLINNYGIEGAAIAWVLRVLVDSIVLFGMSLRILSISPSTIERFVVCGVAAIMALLIAITLPVDLILKASFTLLGLITFAFIGWFKLLAPEERLFVRYKYKKMKAAKI